MITVRFIKKCKDKQSNLQKNTLYHETKHTLYGKKGLFEQSAML